MSENPNCNWKVAFHKFFPEAIGLAGTGLVHGNTGASYLAANSPS